jgi:hypothetical protein
MRSNTVQEPRLILDLSVEEAVALQVAMKIGVGKATGTDKELATAIGIAARQFTDAQGVVSNGNGDASASSDS